VFRRAKSGLTMALALDPFLRLSASRRRDAAPIQGGGDLPKRLRPGGLCLAGGRHDCGGVRLGVGLEAAVGDRAGVDSRGLRGLPRTFAAASAAASAHRRLFPQRWMDHLTAAVGVDQPTRLATTDYRSR
jgi:hypothetical protein